MKAIITSLTLILSIGIHAQITIDESDILESEDSVGVSTSLDLSIDFATTGQNHTWDFSTLTANESYFETAKSMASGGVVINFQFGPFADAEYQSSYFQNFDGLPVEELTNFLPVQINSVNRMIKVESNQLTFPGYALEVSGQVIGFQSDTIEKAYEFPLSFGDSYESVGYTDINFSPVYEARIKMHRKRTSSVDGYGQLITPHESYDVLRVHHVINELDSIYVEIGPLNQWIPLNRTLHEYEWWAKDKKRPVLKVETETLGTNEVPSRISYINNQTSSTHKEKLSTHIYPNPSKGVFTISAEKRLKKLSVYSLEGRKVFQREDLGHKSSIDLSHLETGSYFIHAYSEKDQSFQTIIIQ